MIKGSVRRVGIDARANTRGSGEAGRTAAVSADLVLLALLLVVMAMFGRPFSKLGVPAFHVYVTELTLALVAVLALRRVGIRGVVERVRRSVPLLPLAVLWVAGAVATVRGLQEFGVGMVTHDVGLVLYSVLVPLVAVVVDTPAKGAFLMKALFLAGLGATVVFALVFFLAPRGALGVDQNPRPAVGLYMALLVFLVGTRVVHRRAVSPYEYAFLVAALVLMSLTVVRSVVLALATAAAALVLLSPAGRRLVATGLALAAMAISVGGALALQKAGLGLVDAQGGDQRRLVYADPDLVADDAAIDFEGGRVVVGDAATGRESREVDRGETLKIEQLTGLEVGSFYTVRFSIKPLEPKSTLGFVGDPTGIGWGRQGWRTARQTAWQSFQATLPATGPTQRLAIGPVEGASAVRVDAIAVLKGRRDLPEGVKPVTAGGVDRDANASARDPSSPSATPPAPAPAPSQPADEAGKRDVPLATDIGDVSDPYSGPGSNVRWRLAVWAFMLREAADAPIFGVGFGRPTAFEWRGVTYDARTGDPNNAFDVTAPHNSFVNLVYRTGLVGLLPFVALVLIAAMRAIPAIRSAGAASAERALLTGLAVIFVFAVVIASFNVALENPYVGVFFWTLLGLLLILPRFAAAARNSDPPP